MRSFDKQEDPRAGYGDEGTCTEPQRWSQGPAADASDQEILAFFEHLEQCPYHARLWADDDMLVGTVLTRAYPTLTMEAAPGEDEAAEASVTKQGAQRGEEGGRRKGERAPASGRVLKKVPSSFWYGVVASVQIFGLFFLPFLQVNYTLQTFERGDEAERLEAAEFLARIGSEVARERLQHAMVTSESYFRFQLAEVLAKHGDTAAMAFVRGVLEQKNDAVLRLKAIEALGRIKGQAAIALLHRVLDEEPDAVLRLNAIDALEHIGGEPVAQLLGQVLNEEPDAVLRLKAIAALGHIGGASVVGVLQRVLEEEPDAVLCFEAEVALEKIRKRLNDNQGFIASIGFTG